MSIHPLLRFLLQRAVSAVLLMLAAASFMLLLTRITPGDAVTSDLVAPGISQEAIVRERARLGLDQPIARQYAIWLSHAVRLDFGTSFRYQRPVTSLVIERAGNTALLAMSALLIASIVGLPLGVIAGSGRMPRLARLVRLASLFGLSLPPLLTALVLAWMAARTGWFPIGGLTSAGASDLSFIDQARDHIWHLVLPALSLALPLSAVLERLQADAVAAVRAEPFVLGALARGLPISRVIWCEIWRPSLGPVLAVYSMTAGQLLSGSLVVELVTSWPGLGRLMLDALGGRDVPLATGCSAAAALLLMIWTTIGDLATAGVDPRARAMMIGSRGDEAAIAGPRAMTGEAAR
jgi:peptide/nickel transport system permease protein